MGMIVGIYALTFVACWPARNSLQEVDPGHRLAIGS
jgi:hypothetical protein